MEEHTNECWLTTRDNPFNPFDDFDNWFRFDCDHNYKSNEIVMRNANISDSMTETEADIEIERAIDYWISIDPLDIYIKITPDMKITPTLVG